MSLGTAGVGPTCVLNTVLAPIGPEPAPTVYAGAAFEIRLA